MVISEESRVYSSRNYATFVEACSEIGAQGADDPVEKRLEKKDAGKPADFIISTGELGREEYLLVGMDSEFDQDIPQMEADMEDNEEEYNLQDLFIKHLTKFKKGS